MKTGEYEIREKFYYSKDHEWVKIEGNFARVGVTDYAQRRLGDIVFVELPEVGKKVKQAVELKTREMEIGALESIKAVSVVYSPLNGTVREVNSALQDQPELVNTSPYNEGWICVIEPASLGADLKNLMDAKAYTEHIKKLR